MSMTSSSPDLRAQQGNNPPMTHGDDPLLHLSAFLQNDGGGHAPPGHFHQQLDGPLQCRDDAASIHSLFEAVAGFGAESQSARSPANQHRIKTGRFDQDPGGPSVTSELAPPMTPARPRGLSPSVIRMSSGLHSRITPSSVSSRSPCRALRTRILPPEIRS